MIRLRNFLLVGVTVVAVALSSWGAVFLSVGFAPPPLPVYAQPICPGPGYLWTPGYWGYGPGGYYWIPGTWVIPPAVGLLWTPGYWGFSAGLYLWNPGYWGPTVGFYGGINYGWGYPGFGYYGGYWRGHNFYYNRAVNHINIANVHHVYVRNVANNVNARRVSYNGGAGGVRARPTSAQMAFARQHHEAATSAQIQHQQAARNQRSQFASMNHGRPAVTATARPETFKGRETTQAREASRSYHQSEPEYHAYARPPETRFGEQPHSYYRAQPQFREAPHANYRAEPHFGGQPHAYSRGGAPRSMASGHPAGRGSEGHPR